LIDNKPWITKGDIQHANKHLNGEIESQTLELVKLLWIDE
jgi:hypothetical protein